MIIVTGATGQLGRGIVENLLQRIPANRVGVSVRDLERAGDLAQRGVRVRQGDFERPESLARAFEGATQVLLVSSNARAHGGDTLAQHRAAIDAARAAGARRVVFTSHMAASRTSAFPPMHDHAATELMLHESGLAWTALRNGFYAASALMFLGDALKSGSLEVPEDGKVSWTTHADLAQAAAAIVVDEGKYDGPTAPLTGSDALDLSDLTAIASRLLDKRIRRSVVGDEEFRAAMAARGAPARVADIALGFYRASRTGEFATVNPTMERLLGRRPIAMTEVLAKTLAR